MNKPPSIISVMTATLVALNALPWWRRTLLDWFGIGRDLFWKEYLKARKNRVVSR